MRKIVLSKEASLDSTIAKQNRIILVIILGSERQEIRSEMTKLKIGKLYAAICVILTHRAYRSLALYVTYIAYGKFYAL